MEALWQLIEKATGPFADSVFLALIKENRYQYLVNGLGISLILTLIAAVLGLVLGLLLAIAKLQDVDRLTGNRFVVGLRRCLAGFANGYISVIRGTPSVVQLLVIYFVIFAAIRQADIPGLSQLPDIWIAGIAFGLNSAAYVAEVIRAGIMAVDKGQTEAGRSLGLSAGITMVSIVIPQAIKNVLPAMGNEFITLLKETSIAGYIAIPDLTKGAQAVGGSIYNYMVPLLCAAYMYFLMTTVLSFGLGVLERRLHKSD